MIIVPVVAVALMLGDPGQGRGSPTADAAAPVELQYPSDQSVPSTSTPVPSRLPSSSFTPVELLPPLRPKLNPGFRVHTSRVVTRRSTIPSCQATARIQAS